MVAAPFLTSGMVCVLHQEEVVAMFDFAHDRDLLEKGAKTATPLDSWPSFL
jgi:hypothetical protein